MNVLITSVRAPSAVDMARALTAAGHNVIGIDSFKYPCGRFSNALHFERTVSPKLQTHQYIDQVKDIVKRHDIELMIPTCEDIFYLSAYREHFPTVRVYAPEFPLIESLHNKFSFAALTKGLSIEAPQTHVVTSLNEESKVCDQRVYKPSYSRFGASVLIQPERSQLKKVLEHSDAQWISQECIQGIEICSYSLCVNGEVLSHVSYLPEYKAGGGAATVFRKLNHPKIESFIKEFAGKYKITGQISFDFMEDVDGNVSVLECNPRTTSGAHLMSANELVKGLDVPSKHLKKNHEPILKAIKLAFMSYYALNMFKRGRVQFLEDVRTSKDVLWGDGDSTPFWAQILFFAELVIKALVMRKGLTDVTTYDIEWNGDSLDELV